MRLYLVRHGDTGHDPSGTRYIGVTDTVLSEDGKKQAAELGKWLKTVTESGSLKIYTSPLSRCRETAEILAVSFEESGRPVPVVIDDLREIDLGDWEGRRISEVRASEPEEYEERGRDMWNYRTPGGETFAETGKRVSRTLEELAAASGPDDTVIAVTHAGAIRAALSLMTDRTFEELVKTDIPYASATEIIALSKQKQVKTP